MSIDNRISCLVLNTVSKADQFNKRMTELIATIDKIRILISNSSVTKFKVNDTEYDYDDLLIMVFELIQLIEIFRCFDEAGTILSKLLLSNYSRLVELCLEGRLNHVAEVIEFKRIVS